MYKLLEKIREQQENTKKIIAAVITAVIMGIIGWAWIFTMKDNFDFGAKKDGENSEEAAAPSPFEALKENFAAIKNLRLEQEVNSEIKSENNNFEFFNKLKSSLGKGWHWAYDPLKK